MGKGTGVMFGKWGRLEAGSASPRGRAAAARGAKVVTND